MSPTDPARTLATQLPDTPSGARITLMGHVHRRRELATVSFLILRDRTGLAQIGNRWFARLAVPHRAAIQLGGNHNCDIQLAGHDLQRPRNVSYLLLPRHPRIGWAH